MDDRLTIRLVDSWDRADPEAVCVMLYEEEGKLMGWYIGPGRLVRHGLWLPYLPRSARQSVGLAVTGAMTAAIVAQCNVCVVDPCGLWALV